MDAKRFDLFVRTLTATPSRRAIARALTGLAAAGGLGGSIGLSDVEAKKKKKKKKCKAAKGLKKCGKKCISATSCCSDADCGGATCLNGACACPSGQKDCQGACVAQDACCPACTGGKVCAAGTCQCLAGQQECQGSCISANDCCPACPSGQTCESGECLCPPGEIPCGNACIDELLCCTGENCGPIYTCQGGQCICPDAAELPCSETECCDTAANEVCALPPNSDNFCQAGGCPGTDFCVDLDLFLCERDCVCTDTVDPMPEHACIDFASLQETGCEPCMTSAQCGAGSVCIADGEFCGCGGSFCAARCSEGAPRARDRGRASARAEAISLKSENGKRRLPRGRR